jgi:GDPmannose 4,6-dehydratase
MKKALILGITGQDGSYLADILLEKGYEVHGLIRRSATGNTKNINHILGRITLHPGDLADPISLFRTINEVRPQEIYNEADQDHAGWSFQTVGYSFDITAAAVGRLLEIVRQIDPGIRFFQPVSSNMFGRVTQSPQTEETPFRPQSPYACAKVCAFVTARYYRDAFGMFVATGIFYNHESPRRTEEYVSRKITRAAVKIALGLQHKLRLGDLSAEIDFGYSKEYMLAAWSIMQLPDADDFIICTGETHSIRELLESAFAKVGLSPDPYVEIDQKLIRPAKTDRLVGDFSKAHKAFGFNPQIRFQELVQMLVEHDMRELQSGLK